MKLLNAIINNEFYPTPASLAQKMIEGIDWKMVKTILEPSAGKGDILKKVAWNTKDARNKEFDVDCIESDADLRQILKYNFSKEYRNNLRREIEEILKVNGYEGADDRFGYGDWRYQDRETREYLTIPEDVAAKTRTVEEKEKSFFQDGIHIVADDFLSFEAFKQYDLILMNPPFSDGDKHLLKALDIQKVHGGSVVCILNAETIRNPYTETRKALVHLLEEYHADIEYIEDAFCSAERTTGVEIALIKVNIPKKERDDSIFDRMAKEEHYKEFIPDECNEIEVTDFITSIVNRYKVEIKSGLELIRIYEDMQPYLQHSFDKGENRYVDPLICLKDTKGDKLTVNEYVRSVRLKYWRALLSNKKFVGKLTSTLQKEYRTSVNRFADYDFSEFNIRALLTEMNCQIKSGIEEEIDKMYDRLTEEHSYYPECQKNRHYYSGWKTNKAWKIDKKVILPCYGVFGSWDGRPYAHEAYSTLADIERILNFFDGNMSAEVDLRTAIEACFHNGVTKNIQTKFFKATFYKKGTVHITFTCPDLIDRFNIYAAQSRGWLPPCYGKKTYEEMSDEEKTVVDEFQGKEKYEEILKKSDYYLQNPVKNDILRLGA